MKFPATSLLPSLGICGLAWPRTASDAYPPLQRLSARGRMIHEVSNVSFIKGKCILLHICSHPTGAHTHWGQLIWGCPVQKQKCHINIQAYWLVRLARRISYFPKRYTAFPITNTCTSIMLKPKTTTAFSETALISVQPPSCWLAKQYV